MKLMKQFYITISREFASGGADVSYALAKALNIPTYNKSLVEFTSIATGINKDLIANSEDKVTSSFWYHDFLKANSGLSVYDQIYIGQTKVIKELADKGSCIFVGRCASCVLSERENVVNIFIQAPIGKRIEWAMHHYNTGDDTAEKLLKKHDKARAKYYSTYSTVAWGDRANYDLIINNTDIETTVDVILAYLYGKGYII